MYNNDIDTILRYDKTQLSKLSQYSIVDMILALKAEIINLKYKRDDKYYLMNNKINELNFILNQKLEYIKQLEFENNRLKNKLNKKLTLKERLLGTVFF